MRSLLSAPLLARCAAVALGATLSACNSRPTHGAPSPAPATASEPAATAAHPVVFRDGDLAGALERARASHTLVVVEIWAQWCPPCMAMRAGTFPDRALYALADRFLWVSIDRDSDEGEALATRLGVDGIPALFVFDPALEAPIVRWNYPVSGPELADLLRAVAAAPAIDGRPEIFASSLVSGRPDTVKDTDRERVQGLLERSPASWPFAPFAVTLLLADAKSREASGECAALATRYRARLPAGSLRTALVIDGQACAQKTTPPQLDVARTLLDEGEALVNDPTTPILAWDRAWRFATLRRGREHLGDAAGVARVGDHWLSFLRAAQAKADPAERAVLAPSLQFALEVLGDPTSALAALAEAVRSAPDDAEALLRYASALESADRTSDALAALARGSPSVAPARRVPVLWEESTLRRKLHDRAGEIRALDAAAVLFPVTPRSPHFDAARKKIAARRDELARDR